MRDIRGLNPMMMTCGLMELDEAEYEVDGRELVVTSDEPRLRMLELEAPAWGQGGEVSRLLRLARETVGAKVRVRVPRAVMTKVIVASTVEELGGKIQRQLSRVDQELVSKAMLAQAAAGGSMQYNTLDGAYADQIANAKRRRQAEWKGLMLNVESLGAAKFNTLSMKGQAQHGVVTWDAPSLPPRHGVLLCHDRAGFGWARVVAIEARLEDEQYRARVQVEVAICLFSSPMTLIKWQTEEESF